MALQILFSAGPGDWADYQPHLAAALAGAGVDAAITTAPDDPASFDFVIWSPASPLQDFRPFTRLRAVFSLWAGVERVAGNQTLQVPLVRMIDPGLTAGMTEYVAGHVLRCHLGLDGHILRQDGVWRHSEIPPLAASRHVGILGLGALGQACAQALQAYGFALHGWSRQPKTLPGISCHHGQEGLHDLLAACEILVLLLPLTPETEDLFDAALLARTRRGAFLINAGRGKLIVDKALIAALDSGQIAHATLDVFRQEPLPPAHPFWAHPGVTVTPHLAAETRPASAARSLARNLALFLEGKTPPGTVDFAAGY